MLRMPTQRNVLSPYPRDDATMTVLVQAPPVKRSLKIADATLAATASSATPDTVSSAGSGISARVPFGYAQGAICVEPPKRQRV